MRFGRAKERLFIEELESNEGIGEIDGNCNGELHFRVETNKKRPKAWKDARVSAIP